MRARLSNSHGAIRNRNIYQINNNVDIFHVSSLFVQLQKQHPILDKALP